MLRNTLIGRSRRRRGGFTLLEVLISVGIVVLLVALSLVGIAIARKRGIEIRIRSDLALIGTALEAYKHDFGDYPRFDDYVDSVNQTDLNSQHDRGARLLCRTLLGPAPATAPQGRAGYIHSAGEVAPDGADGPGFRLRGTSGKVYGPYLDASKFKLGNSGTAGWDTVYFVDATILDINGNTILYYPGLTSAAISINTTGTNNAAYVQSIPPPGGNFTTPPVRPMYNAWDNEFYGTSPLATDSSIPTHSYLLSAQQMAYILGDRNLKGYIDTTSTPPESPVTTQSYLLWTAGPDGRYGFGLDPTTGAPLVPAAGMKTDDITNFDIPMDLHK